MLSNDQFHYIILITGQCNIIVWQYFTLFVSRMSTMSAVNRLLLITQLNLYNFDIDEFIHVFFFQFHSDVQH